MAVVCCMYRGELRHLLLRGDGGGGDGGGGGGGAKKSTIHLYDC